MLLNADFVCLLIDLLCLHVSVLMCTCRGLYVETIGQLIEVSSLLSVLSLHHIGSGIKLGFQGCQ